MRIGYLVNDAEGLKPDQTTTLLIHRCALRGHDVWVFDVTQLTATPDGAVMVRAPRATSTEDVSQVPPNLRSALNEVLKLDSLDPNATPATYTATTKNYRWMPVQSGAAMADDSGAATLHGSWHLSRFKGWEFTQAQTGAGEAGLVAKAEGSILMFISPEDIPSATQLGWSISPAASLVVEHAGRLEPRVAAYRGVAEGEVLTLPISTRDKSVILFRAPAEKDKSIPAGPMLNGDRPDIDALLKAARVVEPAPDWSAISAKSRSILLVRVVTESLASGESVSDLVYLIRASTYIPMAYSVSKPLGVFLSTHPEFGRTLFRAMAEQPRGEIPRP